MSIFWAPSEILHRTGVFLLLAVPVLVGVGTASPIQKGQVKRIGKPYFPTGSASSSGNMDGELNAQTFLDSLGDRRWKVQEEKPHRRRVKRTLINVGRGSKFEGKQVVLRCTRTVALSHTLR